jgi:hypothetical protein
MNNNTNKKQNEQNEASRLWDMSNIDKVAEFVGELQARTSNDQTMIAGIVSILSEIEKRRNFIDAADYCNDVIREFFKWTIEFDQAQRDYVESLNNSTGGISHAINAPEINQRFARHLAEILNHPDTPERLYEGIQEGLTEMHNHDLDASLLDAELKSPEYIERLFNMMKK